MMKRKLEELLGKAGNAIVEGIAKMGSAMGRMLENWQAKEEQRARVIAAQIAYETKMYNAQYVQHDLGVSMTGMTPPAGLTVVHDPSNLTFLENYSTDEKTFALYWQKSVRKFTFSKSDLIAIRDRINSRIKSQMYKLKLCGYTSATAESEYRAFVNGFGVVDVLNDTDGVILMVRIR